MGRPVVQKLAPGRMPAERARRGVRPAYEGLADELYAVVDVVPLAVVDLAPGVDDGRVVPFRVDGFAEGVEAV